MDFGSITNGEIMINVINAHVRTILEVTRLRISNHILQKVVSLTVFTVTGSCRQYVLTHLIRSV